jgi:hypothetical protein
MGGYTWPHKLLQQAHTVDVVGAGIAGLVNTAVGQHEGVLGIEGAATLRARGYTVGTTHAQAATRNVRHTKRGGAPEANSDMGEGQNVPRFVTTSSSHKRDVPGDLGGGRALAKAHGKGSRGEGGGRAEEGHEKEDGGRLHF